MPRPRFVDAVRRVAGHPPLLPLTALLLRALTVRPSSKFVVRELLRRPVTRVYSLRGTDLRIALRHRTGDVVTLGEVFHEPDYRPRRDAEEALADVATVIDLGANIGLFGALATVLWPAAQIVAYEPDPDNAAVHARTIALNGMQSRWRLVRAAAATSDGSASFVAGGSAVSHLADAAEGQDTIEVPTVDVLPSLAEADLVKIDIEGGEWAILEDARFQASPPRAVVLEYHPRFCPGQVPREAAEALLLAAGLQVRSIWHRADGHGMLWAWQT